MPTAPRSNRPTHRHNSPNRLWSPERIVRDTGQGPAAQSGPAPAGAAVLAPPMYDQALNTLGLCGRFAVCSNMHCRLGRKLRDETRRARQFIGSGKCQLRIEPTRSELAPGTVGPGAIDAFGRRPLSRASRPVIGPILNGCKGSIPAVRPAAHPHSGAPSSPSRSPTRRSSLICYSYASRSAS